MAREISEHDATLAVDAAARKVYEDDVARMLQHKPDAAWADWDDLTPAHKLAVRQQVLPIVWAALGALPDQRHAAFEEGWAKAWTPLSPHDLNDSHNPYPAEEA